MFIFSMPTRTKLLRVFLLFLAEYSADLRRGCMPARSEAEGITPTRVRCQDGYSVRNTPYRTAGVGYFLLRGLLLFNKMFRVRNLRGQRCPKTQGNDNRNSGKVCIHAHICA